MDVRLNDIANREDVELFVNEFYDRVRKDTLLAPEFSHVDWPKHLPVMYSFWSSMLLGERSYAGNPLQKHLPLPINQLHFSRWLALFIETIDSLFSGEKAEEVKLRAKSIAAVFQSRMGLN